MYFARIFSESLNILIKYCSFLKSINTEVWLERLQSGIFRNQSQSQSTINVQLIIASCLLVINNHMSR